MRTNAGGGGDGGRLPLRCVGGDCRSAAGDGWRFVVAVDAGDIVGIAAIDVGITSVELSCDRRSDSQPGRRLGIRVRWLGRHWLLRTRVDLARRADRLRRHRFRNFGGRRRLGFRRLDRSGRRRVVVFGPRWTRDGHRDGQCHDRHRSSSDPSPSPAVHREAAGGSHQHTTTSWKAALVTAPAASRADTNTASALRSRSVTPMIAPAAAPTPASPWVAMNAHDEILRPKSTS